MKFPGGCASGRVFIVSKAFGVNGCGSSVIEGMAVIGRELTIPVTSAIRVERGSWVSWELPISKNIASKRRRIVPIWRSQTPPK